MRRDTTVFHNLRLFWKFALLAFVTPISVGIVAGIALLDTGPSVRLYLPIAAVLLTAFGLVAAWWLARSLTAPMAILVEALDNMGLGNLNRQMTEASKQALRGRKDEMGRVA